MRLHRGRPSRRAGFTLIEVMVVVTIIIVLVSLLSSAVMLAINKMDEVKTSKEIGSLGSGLVQVQTDFNVQKGAPPSRIWLDETGNYSAVPAGVPAGTTLAQLQQLAVDSEAYLRRVWPRHAYPIDWDCDGTPGDSSVVLEGEQCLVFFLGGARNAGGQFIGFSTDSTNPINLALNTRKGPYFQFDMTRISPNGAPQKGSYPYYLDPYGTPYAYFSSGMGTNKYNAYAAATSLGQYDCPSLKTPAGAAIQPYYQPAQANQAIQYYNPDTVQIISAGKNQQWGAGGSWTPNTGAGVGTAGIDDMSNFYNAKLGVTP